MRFLLIPAALMCAVLVIDAAMAQQQPVPLTDWRAQIDNDLSKLSMPRDAHAAVFNILQAYERQYQRHPEPPAGAPQTGESKQ
jgi:hypothetical protein